MIEVLGIALIIIGILLVLTNGFLTRFNDNAPKERRDNPEDICILIPARDESKVIGDLLRSIKEQTKIIPMKNVYVIIETQDDPTKRIAEMFGASVFIRQHAELQSKGYALKEIIEELDKKQIFFDLYYIIDADNILDKKFLEEMEKTYCDGYDIAIGYRNLKNGNDSVIAACSGITFSFLNSNGNETKSKQTRNITLSGTGLFIVGDLIKKWSSFPFHSLTEDYELSLYTMENNLTSIYNAKAMFYDEQPIKYKSTINQRIRWIKGYFDNRKKYIPKFRKILKNNPNFGSLINEIIGMKPYILMIIGAFCYILNQLIIIFSSKEDTIIVPLVKIFLIIFLAYVLFMLMTLFVVYKDRDKINLSKKMRVKAVLFSPLFFVTYVPCALKAFLKKDVVWQKVEHNRHWNG